MVSGIIGHMARCTAPVRGHRSAAAAAECPACGGRYGRYGGYSNYPSYPSTSYSLFGSNGGQPERWWRVRHQHKAPLVASQFVSVLHGC